MDPLTVLMIVLLVLWLTGTGFAIGGSAIHLLLLIVLVILVARVLERR